MLQTFTKNTIRYEDFLRFPGAEDKGRYIVMRCPFHADNDPSLLVYPDGFFHCLADCGRSGSWKTLMDKLNGQPIVVRPEKRIHYKSPRDLLLQTYTEASSVEEAAYLAYRDLSNWPTFQWYLEMRGLSDAVEIHEIGYVRGWYTIPIRDRDYKFENIVYRAAPHVQKVIGMRYWASGKPSMFVPDWHLLDECDYLIVVFGMFDALTLNKFRLPVISPTHGHTFDPSWLDGYRKPIYVIPDKGEERAGLRLTASLGWRGKMARLDWPQGMKDANDYLQAGRQDELQAQLLKVIR